MNTKLFIIFFIVNIGCSLATKESDTNTFENSPFMQIHLGDSEKSIVEKLGQTSSTNVEKFTSKEYKVYEYSKKEGPLAFFTIDKKNGLVVGRSLWIDNKKNLDLSSFLKEKFANYKFKKFYPCHSYGEDVIYFDSEKGFSLATQNDKVKLVMWSEPELTKLRINRFYEKCSKLQDQN